jgi:polyhydroxybutyrate depolymerase
MLMRVLAASLLLAAACGSDDTTPPVERPLEFGGTRPVSLQVPGDFAEGRTYPLLLILHGYSANGFIQQAYFRMGGVADTDDVFVLAPDGTTDSSGKQFWNSGPECCDVDGTEVDDVAYLGGLLDDVMAAWPIDPARIHVLGHSNGAFMAYRLACDRADVVTSIAGLAGHATSNATPCAPADTVSVLHLHGTADDTVPYDSGLFAGLPSPGAIESVAQWATRNHCTGAPTDAGSKDITSTDGAETTVRVTAGCPADGAADLWTIPGGGHIPALAEPFPTEIMAWFAAHPRT